MTQRRRNSGETTGVYVALLRGINLGGKNKLLMKDLVAIFEGAGCKKVRTYIQSGNVVFEAGEALAGRVPVLIPEAIADRCKIQVPVVLRSAKEIRSVVRNNRFLSTEAELSKLLVAFLAEKPSSATVGALDPDRSPPDQFVVRGREIYLHCPNGFARSKLTTAYFDSKLGTTSTVRGWKTVLKLNELAAEG